MRFLSPVPLLPSHEPDKKAPAALPYRQPDKLSVERSPARPLPHSLPEYFLKVGRFAASAVPKTTPADRADTQPETHTYEVSALEIIDPELPEKTRAGTGAPRPAPYQSLRPQLPGPPFRAQRVVSS